MKLTIQGKNGCCTTAPTQNIMHLFLLTRKMKRRWPNTFGTSALAMTSTFKERQSKTTPLYAIPLHAHAFSIANFFRSGIRDTDLSIFHPSAVGHLVIDDALFYLRDTGVIANVHTLCA
jgi:hypothetical protein